MNEKSCAFSHHLVMFCHGPVDALTGPCEFILFCCCYVVVLLHYLCVYVSVYMPSTRSPHNPASIHHSPPSSHSSRSYCTIRHPCLRPHSHWRQRYSTTPCISISSSACHCVLPLPSYLHVSVLACQALSQLLNCLMWTPTWRH